MDKPVDQKLMKFQFLMNLVTMEIYLLLNLNKAFLKINLKHLFLTEHIKLVANLLFFLLYNLIKDYFLEKNAVEDWSVPKLQSDELCLKEQSLVVMRSDEPLHRSPWAIAPSM